MRIYTNKNFSVPAEAFGISASDNGYVLNYSVDGVTFTAYSTATPANEVLFVVGLPKHCVYKLVSNTDEELLLQY